MSRFSDLISAPRADAAAAPRVGARSGGTVAVRRVVRRSVRVATVEAAVHRGDDGTTAAAKRSPPLLPPPPPPTLRPPQVDTSPIGRNLICAILPGLCTLLLR